MRRQRMGQTFDIVDQCVSFHQPRPPFNKKPSLPIDRDECHSMISAVPPSFGLDPQLILFQKITSATSFDICADFPVTPLPITNGIQNTSE